MYLVTGRECLVVSSRMYLSGWKWLWTVERWSRTTERECLSKGGSCQSIKITTLNLPFASNKTTSFRYLQLAQGGSRAPNCSATIEACRNTGPNSLLVPYPLIDFSFCERRDVDARGSDDAGIILEITMPLRVCTAILKPVLVHI